MLGLASTRFKRGALLQEHAEAKDHCCATGHTQMVVSNRSHVSSNRVSGVKHGYWKLATRDRRIRFLPCRSKFGNLRLRDCATSRQVAATSRLFLRPGHTAQRPDWLAGLRTRTRKRHFGKAVEIVGEFSLDHPNILGPETFRARAATRFSK
jgi:hypothetical protein